MRTIIKNVYTYSELSDEAKQRALESYRANDYQHEYAWSDEYRNTMEAFCNLFPVRVNNWQISSYSYSFIDHDFTGDDSEKELTGLALAKHLLYHYEDALYQGKYYGHLSNKEDDSITARDTFNAVCDQSDNLRCIFTPRQVQALTKIN